MVEGDSILHPITMIKRQGKVKVLEEEIDRGKILVRKDL